jgi:hypothetical protein
MLRINTVGVFAFTITGEDSLPFVDWLSKGFLVKLSLPRDTFCISVFDDE